MSDVRIKIARLQENLSRRFLEREHVIDGCLAAILTGEHVLLIGPPGTAKSALARSIAQAFGGSYFEWLLTKHSKPDELFGPISLRALEQDRFERSIEGKLPTVEFAFTDEIFKSSSTILNSLLTLMNERLFHNGGDPLKCPLVTLFGASNELPQGGDLEALYDRFMLRYEVKYLTRRESRLSVFTSPNPEPEQLLTMDDLRQAQEEVKKVQLSDDTIDGLLTVQEALRTNGIELSDRRWKKCYSLVKVSAYLAGNDETCPDDIRSITDALWREPKERDRVAQLVLENAEPLTERVREVAQIIFECSREWNRTSGDANKVKEAEKLSVKYGEQRKQMQIFAESGGKHLRVKIAGYLQQLDNVMMNVRKLQPPQFMNMMANLPRL